jgi:hypothetical protein
MDPADDRDTYVADKGREAHNSCAWIHTEPQFIHWDDPNNASQLLWLCGPEGTGKTMLSVYLSRHFESTRTKNDTVLYYFCDGDEPERNSAVGILRGLLYQLVCEKKKDVTPRTRELDRERKEKQALREILLQTYHVKKDKMLAPDILWKVFYSMIKAMPTERVTVIIDAAEKCEKRPFELLLKKFKADFMPSSLSAAPTGGPSSSSGSSALKLIVLARNTPEDWSYDLRDIPCLLLTGCDNFCRSVQAYVQDTADELARSQRYDGFKRYPSLRILTDGTQSFLRVKQIAQQLRKSAPDSLMRQMNNPDDLDIIYLQALRSIPEDSKNYCAAMMHWIYGAQRPLKLDELAEALTVDDSYPSDAQVNDGTLRQAIQYCEDLVEINASEETVSFVRESIPEFLSRQVGGYCLQYNAELSMFFVEPQLVRSNIIKACLAYLSYGCLDDPAFFTLAPTINSDDNSCDNSAGSLNVVKAAYPFRDYSVRYLVSHLRDISPGDSLFDRPFFASSSSQRDAWWAAYSFLQLSDYDYHPPENPPLVHVAAYTGCLPILKYLAQEDRLSSCLHEADAKKVQPCTYSIYKRHVKVVEFLLD